MGAHRHWQHSAQRSRERSAPYTATKFGVGTDPAAALEGRDYGIAVSALHPGGHSWSAALGQQHGREADEEPMFDVDVIARTALLMVTLPPEANMLEAIVLPLEQKYIGRG